MADTYAWVLLKNHFHLLVRIKEEMVYKYSPEDFKTPSNADGSRRGRNAVRFEEVKWETVNSLASIGPDDVNINDGRKKANPTKHFSHLFNAYTKHQNEKYGRHGNLFQRPFKRKPIDDEDYLQRVIIYIHSNPVHHGFVNHLTEYPWSSYQTCLSPKPTKLQRKTVLDWFGSADNFKDVHHDHFDHAALEAWLDGEEE